MGKGFQQVKTKTRVAVKSKPVVESPLDIAKAYEVEWEQVCHLFDAMRGAQNSTFVYFIGEENDGAVKIGLAKDPIRRLRGMQTGNPRRLRVERVLVGDRDIEHLLHEMWEKYAIRSLARKGKFDAAPGTEWFRPEIRDELFPAVEMAAAFQVSYLTTVEGPYSVQELESCVRRAHGCCGIEAKRREVVHLLASGAGYVKPGRRSRV